MVHLDLHRAISVSTVFDRTRLRELPDPTAPDVERETAAEPAADRALATQPPLSMPLSHTPAPAPEPAQERRSRLQSPGCGSHGRRYGNHVRTHANQGGR
jgi:hypothetical protein